MLWVSVSLCLSVTWVGVKVGVCDCEFQILRGAESNWVGRKTSSIYRSISGNAFDPAVVEACMTCLRQWNH